MIYYIATEVEANRVLMQVRRRGTTEDVKATLGRSSSSSSSVVGGKIEIENAFAKKQEAKSEAARPSAEKGAEL
jgi:hypothetical protein